MPKTFHVTAPDGHTLEITGPDDATEDQALQQAQSLYQPKQQKEAPKNELPGGFSRYFSSVVDALNPLPAIEEYLNRPGELGKAADALKTLDSIHKRASEMPENKGKPVNKWIEPKLTAEEAGIVDRGMNANLMSHEAPNPMLQPAIAATGQAAKGDIAGAAGTLTGGYVAPAAIGAVIPKVAGAAGAVARVPGKLVEMVKTPGGLTMAKGGVQAAGGAGALAGGHPFIGGGLLVRGWENIVKGMEERRAAQNAPPPILEDLAQSLKGKSFGSLSESEQTALRDISTKVREVKPPSGPPPAEGPIDLGSPSPKSKTMRQLIDENILERKAQAAQAGPVDVQPQPAQSATARPGPTPEAFSGGPVLPDSHLLPILDHQTGETVGFVKKPKAQAIAKELAKEQVGSEEGGTIEGTTHPPTKAYEATYQAKRAQVIADRLHEAGISYEEASALTPDHLKPAQWEAILGKDPQTGEQFHTPSQETLNQARVRLAHKYAAGKNEASRAIAEELAKEMAK